MESSGWGSESITRGARRALLWLVVALVLLALGATADRPATAGEGAVGGLTAAPMDAGAETQAADGDVPGLNTILLWLSGSGVAVAVGAVLSWVVEYWPKYDSLDARYKRLIFFGMCLFLPITAALLRGVLGYVELTFEPLIWTAIWNGIGAAGIGTLVHTRKLPA